MLVELISVRNSDGTRRVSDDFKAKAPPKLPDLFAWLGSWQLVLRFACFGFLFMTE